jgi:hypothetical protein
MIRAIVTLILKKDFFIYFIYNILPNIMNIIYYFILNFAVNKLLDLIFGIFFALLGNSLIKYFFFIINFL